MELVEDITFKITSSIWIRLTHSAYIDHDEQRF